MVNALATQRPDAIVFNPADVARLAEPFKAVTALGIPVINIVNRANYADKLAFVGADDEKIGYVAAQHLFRAMSGKGRLVILEGPASTTTARDRANGFQRALKEHPGVTVVANADGRYQQPDARAQMRAILAKGITLDALLAANDAMALGALDALAEARHPAVKAVGINGIPEAVRAVAEGRLLASLDFNGFRLGCIAGMAALRHLRGQPVPRTIHLPIEIIDKANCAKFIVPLEQLQCPAWEELVP
jgi:ribose transport system substrate-binding protein